MNPQQNQLALLTVFNNPAIVDYLKNLLAKQKNILHNDVGLHMEAFNSLSVSQNMNSQIEALRNSIRQELKKEMETTTTVQ